MSTHRLDVPALYGRLDNRRLKRDLSWRGVGRETGLPPSTFSRLSQGHPIEADALVTLLVWLGMETYLTWAIAPGDGPVDCPECGRPYAPRRDGQVRKHGCDAA